MIWHFPQLISLISPSCANISYVVDIYYRTKTRISEFIHRACMILNRDYSPVTGLTDKRFRSPDVHDSLWLQSKPQPPGQYRLPSQHSTQTLNTGSRFAIFAKRGLSDLCVFCLWPHLCFDRAKLLVIQPWKSPLRDPEKSWSVLLWKINTTQPELYPNNRSV